MHESDMVERETPPSRRQPIVNKRKGCVCNAALAFVNVLTIGFGPQSATAFAPASLSSLPGSKMMASLSHVSRASPRLHGLDDVRLRSVTLGKVRLRTSGKNELAMNGGGGGSLAKASGVIAAAPLLAWEGYQHVMRLYPLEMDAMTGALLYILGKWTSNQITKEKSEASVYGKWSVMGSLDGWFTHLWYMWIDQATMFLVTTPALKLFTMTIVTSFCYTPIYCAMFLAVMGALDGKNAQGIVSDVKSRVREMSALTIKTWMPLNVILFGMVPAQYRVLVSMLMNYVYLIGLAMWESGKLATLFSKKEKYVEAGVDFEPINPSPTPGLLNNENVIPTFAVDIAQPIFAFENTHTPWDQNRMATALRTDEGGIIADVPMMHTGTVESLDHAAASPAQPLGDTSNML